MCDKALLGCSEVPALLAELAPAQPLQEQRACTPDRARDRTAGETRSLACARAGATRTADPAFALTLVELRLGGCSDLSLDGLVRLAPAMRTLRVLGLEHMEALRREGPCYAQDTRARLRAGEHAAGSRAERRPVQEVFSALAAFGGAPDLAELRLDGALLDDAAAETLAGVLGPALRVLTIVGVRGLGDAGLRALAASCPGLQTLAVGGGGSAWTALVAFAGLRELRIARCGSMNAGALAAALAPHASTLRRVPRPGRGGGQAAWALVCVGTASWHADAQSLPWLLHGGSA